MKEEEFAWDMVQLDFDRFLVDLLDMDLSTSSVVRHDEVWTSEVASASDFSSRGTGVSCLVGFLFWYGDL